MDIITAIGQEIFILSNSDWKKSNSVSDRFELLAAAKEQEDAHGNDVHVEGEHLVIQPRHNLAFIDDIIFAFFKHNSGLDHLDGDQIDEYLEGWAHNADEHWAHVLFVDLVEVVYENDQGMSNRYVSQELNFSAIDEIICFRPGFSCALIFIRDVEKLIASESMQEQTSGKQTDVHEWMSSGQNVRLNKSVLKLHL